MDELLTEMKTGKIKGISSDGAEVGYGVRRKWIRPQDKHKGKQEGNVTCVWGDSEGESSCKSCEHATGGDQLFVVPLNGNPDEKKGN